MQDLLWDSEPLEKLMEEHVPENAEKSCAINFANPRVLFVPGFKKGNIKNNLAD